MEENGNIWTPTRAEHKLTQGDGPVQLFNTSSGGGNPTCEMVQFMSQLTACLKDGGWKTVLWLWENTSSAGMCLPHDATIRAAFKRWRGFSKTKLWTNSAVDTRSPSFRYIRFHALRFEFV